MSDAQVKILNKFSLRPFNPMRFNLIKVCLIWNPSTKARNNDASYFSCNVCSTTDGTKVCRFATGGLDALNLEFANEKLPSEQT
jgi:hypothetical protein